MTIVHAVGDRDVTPGNDEIERLRSRLERERRARRQAEIIAERRMRELWEANDECSATSPPAPPSC